MPTLMEILAVEECSNGLKGGDFPFRWWMCANRASSSQSGDKKQMFTMLEGWQSSGGLLDRWGRRFS